MAILEVKDMVKAYEDTLATTYGDAAKPEDMVVEAKPENY